MRFARIPCNPQHRNGILANSTTLKFNADNAVILQEGGLLMASNLDSSVIFKAVAGDDAAQERLLLFCRPLNTGRSKTSFGQIPATEM